MIVNANINQIKTPIINPFNPRNNGADYSSYLYFSYPPNRNKYDSAIVPVCNGYTIGNWTGTAGQYAEDTVNQYGGNNTLKIYHTAGVGILNPYGITTLGAAVDISACQYLEFDLYIQDYNAKPYIRFYSIVDNTNNSFVVDMTVATYLNISNVNKPFGWRTVRFPISAVTVTGSLVLNNIVQVKYSVVFDSDITSLVSVANIRGIVMPKALISVDFDDGDPSVYSAAYPTMTAYGLTGTIYMITGNPTGYIPKMTDSQLRDLDNAGWTIANHMNDHLDLTTLTTTQLRYQFETSQQWLRDRGFISGSYCMASPSGTYNSTVHAIAKQYFLTARYLTIPTTDTFPPNDNMHLHYRGVSNTDAVATITGLVDAAITAKSWLKLVFHKIVTPADASTKYTPTNFDSICSYIATQVTAGTVEVVTARDAILQNYVTMMENS